MRSSPFRYALLVSMLLAGFSRAHNLDQRFSYIALDPDTLDRMRARALASEPPLQVGDTIGVLLKSTPGPGTLTGVGGYLTFYLPTNDTFRVVGAQYMGPDPSRPGYYMPVPIKGQSIIALGSGPIGAAATTGLTGLNLGPNLNGITEAATTAGGVHRGTIAGVYADTGIFYSTDPRTVWDSWLNGVRPAKPGGGTYPVLMTNNRGETIKPNTFWDASQLIGFGLSSPHTAATDPNGRGNAAWGLANVVAGPQSGYAWDFDVSQWAVDGFPAYTSTTLKNSVDQIGPWNRIRYAGSQISLDQAGLVSSALGYAGIDGSSVGFDLSEGTPLPNTTTAVRFSFGLLELGRMEVARIELKVMQPFATCPFPVRGDAFGGDAGGEQGGKDHLWRYYDPTDATIDFCGGFQKRFSDDMVTPGSTVGVTLTYFNASATPASNVVVTDPLPSGISYVVGSSKINGVTTAPLSTAPMTWNIGYIPPYSMVDITFDVLVSGAGTLQNCAQVNSSQGLQTACDTIFSGYNELLQWDKLVTPTSVAPGGTVDYTIKIDNVGTGANGVPLVLTEYLPAGFTYVSMLSKQINGGLLADSVFSVNATNPNQPIFTVNQGIQAGKSLILTFRVLVPSTVSPGSYCNYFKMTYEGKTLASAPDACVNVGGGEIGDTIWRDWDGDGVEDAGEEGIPGVTVRLYQDVNNDGDYDVGTDTLLQTQVTDADGKYLFAGLTDGNYVVVVDTTAAGLTQHTNTGDPDGNVLNQSGVSLTGNSGTDLIDFGYQPAGTASIGDKVFNDNGAGGGIAGDGLYNGTEPGIDGVTVNLYEDTNGNGEIDAGDLLVATTVTAGGGNYTFAGLASGAGIDYLVDVDETDPDLVAYYAGFGQTYTASSTDPHVVTNLAGAYTAADFGFVGASPGSIGDTVFFDTDGDGIYDLGSDTPLSGVTVTLYLDSNGDGTAQPEERVTSQETDAAGQYLFDGLSPDRYLVVVDTEDASLPGGSVPVVQQYLVQLNPGQNYLAADFPFVNIFSKSVDFTVAGANDTLTYSINLNLPGDALYQNLTICDPLPGTDVTFVGLNNGGSINGVSLAAPVIGTDTGSQMCHATVRLTAERDTYVDQANPNTNFGTATTFTTSSAANKKHGLLRFNVTSGSIPAGAVLTKAVLSLTVAGGQNADRTVNIHALTNTTQFEEASATWNDPNGATAGTWTGASFSATDYNATTLGAISPAATEVPYSVDITSTVSGWITTPASNKGLVVLATGADTGNVTWYTKENTASGFAPQLVLYYKLQSPGSGCSATLTANFNSGDYSGSGILAVFDGRIDVNGGGGADAGDDGYVGGFSVIDGRVDVNGNGTTGEAADDTVLFGVNVVDSLVDLNASGLGDNADDGFLASSLQWSGNWTESGEADGPTVGNITANSLYLQFNNTITDGSYLRRSTDLSGSASATLMFNVLQNQLDVGESMVVEASGNGGGSFTTLYTLTTGLTGPASPMAVPAALLTSSFVLQVRDVSGTGDVQRFDNFDLVVVPASGPATTSYLATSYSSAVNGTQVTVTQTLRADQAVTGITVPGTLTVTATGTASATYVSGPTLVSADANAGTGDPVVYSYVYTINSGASGGLVKFGSTATGTNANVNPYTFGAATSGEVQVLTAAAAANGSACYNLGSHTLPVDGTRVAGAFLYALRGDGAGTDQEFWRYDPATDLWNNPIDPTDTGVAMKTGASLATEGTYIYATVGNNTTGFRRYDPVGNSWSAMATVPGAVKDGGSLAYHAANGRIYALRGNGQKNLYEYNIGGNSWTTKASLTQNVSSGGALVSSGAYLYAFQGGGKTGFFRYDPVGNAWVARANAPGAVRAGGSLVALGNYLYAFQGATANFWRYDIANNTWSTLATFGATVAGGADLVVIGGGIYGFQGLSTGFKRYNVSSDTWTAVAGAPAATGLGGSLVAFGTAQTFGTELDASPTIVANNQTSTITFTIESTEAVTGYSPPSSLALTTTGGAFATLTAGPSPAGPVNLVANTPATFAYTYSFISGTPPSGVTFSVPQRTSGTSATFPGGVIWPASTSSNVIVAPTLSMQVKVIGSPVGNTVDNLATFNGSNTAGPDYCYVLADGSGAGTDTDVLLRITQDGTVSRLGLTGTTHGEALVLSPDGTVLYTTDRDATVGAGSDRFGTLNTTTGAFAPIGRIASSGNPAEGSLGNLTVLDIDGMAFDPVSGVLYAVSRRESTTISNTLLDILIKINPVTGSHIEDGFGPGVDYVVINTAPLSLYDVDDLTFHPTMGALYAIVNDTTTGEGDGDRLVTINKATGAVTDIGRIQRADNNANIDDVEGLTFSSNGTLHAVTGGGTGQSTNFNTYWIINPTTAKASLTGFASLAPITDPAGNVFDFESLACVSDDQPISATDGAITSLKGAIGDLVWLDINGDGTYDATFAVIDGRVDFNTDGSITAADDGVFGSLQVIDGYLDVNSDGVITAADDGSFLGKTIIDGQVDFNGDASITATDDGTYPAETGIPNVRVYADSDNDGVLDWTDANNNGAWDAGEGETWAYTDALGNYFLYGFTAGTYVVRYDENTTPNGAIPTTPVSHSATLPTDNTLYTAADFGLQPALPPQFDNTIGDLVWLDADEDGIYDVGEQPITNTTVRLYLDNGGTPGVWDPADALISTEVTSSNGEYLFTGLPAGTYFVMVDETDPDFPDGAALVGASPAQPNPEIVTVVGVNTNTLTVDFAYNHTGSIGDFVWYDNNGNGIYEPGLGENPVTNAVALLYVDTNGNGSFDGDTDVQIDTTFTDGSGNYLFDNLPPATYFVKVYEQSVYPEGCPTCLPNLQYTTPSRYTVELDPGEAFLTADFGFKAGAVIEGHVYWDINHNSVLDPNDPVDPEPGIENITVWIDSDADGVLDWVDGNANNVWDPGEGEQWTVTDADGEYAFFVETTGAFLIRYDTADPDFPAALLPAGAETTPLTQIVVVQELGEEIKDVDFGRDNTGAIGDLVFGDRGTSGVYDGPSTDPGLPGVVLELYLDDGDGIFDPLLDSFVSITTTEANGSYLFPGLPDGTYFVKVLADSVPSLYSSTPSVDPTGALDGIASAVISGGNAVLTRDFGYPPVAPGAITGTVFNDGGAAVGDGELNATVIDGFIDINRDGVINSDDDGSFFGYAIIDGKVDVDGSGVVDAADDIIDASFDGKNIIDGLVDFNGSGGITAADDGILSPDTRIPGVVIRLYDDTGALIATTTTDSSGNYTFLGLSAGNYTVEEVGPAGFDSVLDRAGKVADETLNTNTSDDLIPVSVTAGTNSAHNNFLDDSADPAYLANITGQVRNDVDVDGNFADPDAGIDGVAIRLYSDTNGDGVVPLITVIDGKLDLNGDGVVNASDDGLLLGLPVVDGQVDVNNDGAITAADDLASLNGVAVIDGLLDVVPGGGVTAADDGTIGSEPLIATTTTSGGGNYSFTGLPFGDYVVVETDPAGAISTADVDGGNDNQVAVALSFGGSSGNDFLDALTGTVSGHLYADTNGNGVQDGGEPNLSGVDVLVTDSLGNLQIATTDASGNWTATVPPGQTTANVNENDPQFLAAFPSGYVQTDGTDPTEVIAVGGVNTSMGNDGWFNPSGTNSISGTVYNDTGAVGFDAGDTPVAGVLITLYADTNGDRLVPFYTVIDGQLDLNGGGISATDDGVVLDYTIIDGNVDINGDGVINTADDGYFNGIAVYDGRLDLNGSGSVTVADDGTVAGEPVVAVDATASNGTYSFTGLAAGNYVVVETDPSGSTSVDDRAAVTEFPGTDTDNQIGVALTTPENSVGNDFLDSGITTYAISGQVLNDADGSAGFSGADTAIPAVSLSLYADLDGNGVLSPDEQAAGAIASTITNSSGAYSFTGLPNGNYLVVETDPAGAVDVTDVDGAYNTLDVVAVTVSNANVTGRNFLESGVQLASIGDRVWLDEDGDGIQDAGEAGIANVTVNLYDSTGAFLLGTTVTDSEGNYLFPAVPSGATYKVTVVSASLAAGLSANPTYDLDGVGTAHTTNAVVPLGAESVFTADFGYNWAPTPDVTGGTNTGAIGDRVWVDADGDGAQDPGEPGLAGVTVTLTAAGVDGILGTGDDPAPVVTATSADGSYIFDGLPAGIYVVTVTAPANYAQTGDPDATLDHATTTPIVLAPGDVYVNADFGYQPNAGFGATIGDQVWLDLNGNGSLDGSETGIPGVTVALIRDTNGNGVWDAGEPIIASTVTGAAGTYAFTGVPVTDGTGTDDYLVWVNDTGSVLAGLTPTYDNNGTASPNISAVVDLAPVGNVLQDFGYQPPDSTPYDGGTGVIGDTIFLDRDGNSLPGSGEGLEGVTVRLYDAAGTTLLATTVTDENGRYTFAGLVDATYTVKVDTTTLPGTVGQLTNSYDPDAGTANESLVTITGGNTNLLQDFGYQDLTDPNSISGTVWNDTNADGILAGEAGVYAGVTVVLRDAQGDVVATTTTDSFGNYTFAGLPDGTYTVDVTDTANVLNGLWHSIGAPNVDQNSQSDPYTVSLVGGQTGNADFGYYGAPAALGNYVWVDANGNGLQDGGEAALSGATVTLTITWPDASTTVITTVTDGSGLYRFGNLLLDENHDGAGGGEPLYSITVTPPFGYTATLANQGGNDAVDSENSAGQAATVAKGTVNDTYDFGFYLPVNISGSVLQDKGKLTLIEPGDTDPLSGVTVDLFRVDMPVIDGRLDINKDGVIDSTDDGTYFGYTVIDGQIDISANGSISTNDDYYSLAGTRVIAGSLDVNGDGVITIADDGVAASDTVVATDQTDGLGEFSFTNLPPGTYVLRESDPPGYVTTFDNQGGPFDNGIFVTVPSGGSSVGNKFYDALSTTVALMAGFDAGLEDGRAVLRWDTSSEVGTIGFHVYRSDRLNGEYKCVTSALVPGIMTSPQGASYAWVDGGAPARGVAFYKVEEWDDQGGSMLFGPYRAVLDPARPRAVNVELRLAAHETAKAVARIAPADEIAARTLANERRIEAVKAEKRPRGAEVGMKILTRGEGLQKVSLPEIASAFGVTEGQAVAALNKGSIRLTRQAVVIPSHVESGFLLFHAAAQTSAYASESVYWLEQNAGGRKAELVSARPGSAEPGLSFTQVSEIEKDTYQMVALVNNLDDDYWYWDYMNANTPSASKTFPVVVRGLAAGPAHLKIRLGGFTSLTQSPEHKAVAELNGQSIGEVVWDAAVPAVLAADLPAGLLVEGTNWVKITSVLLPGVPYESMVLDSFQLTHARRFEAVDGSLRFTAGNDVTAQVNGFATSEVMVWDVTSPAHPLVLRKTVISEESPGRFSVRFACVPGHVYQAATLVGVATPATDTTLMGNLRRLRSDTEGADYVVIVPRGMEEGANAIAAYRKAQGLSCRVVGLQDLYDAFNGGEPSPLAIRDFLGHARRQWLHKPRYVLLAGSGTYDYKDNMKLGGNLIPALMVQTPAGIFASDLALADVDGGDGIPEMAIGRLPALSSGELLVQLEKIRVFESDVSGWKNQASLVADNPDDGGSFHAGSDALQVAIGSGAQTDKIYLGQLTTAAAKTAVKGAINTGRGLVNYMGHGGNDRMASEGLLLKTDVSGLTNATRPNVMVALTCSMGRYEQPGYDSLGEDLVRKTTGGSVAVWSPTGLSVNSRAQMLGQAFLSARYQNGAEVLGDAILAAHRVYGTQGADTFRVGYIYNLLGDPALRLAGPPALPAAAIAAGSSGSAQRPANVAARPDVTGSTQPKLSGAAVPADAQAPPVAGGEESSFVLHQSEVSSGLHRLVVEDGVAVRVTVGGVVLPVIRVSGSVLWYQAAAGEVRVVTGAASPSMEQRDSVAAGEGDPQVVIVSAGSVLLNAPAGNVLAIGTSSAPLALDLAHPQAPVVLRGTVITPETAPPALYIGAGTGPLLLVVPENVAPVE